MGEKRKKDYLELMNERRKKEYLELTNERRKKKNVHDTWNLLAKQ